MLTSDDAEKLAQALSEHPDFKILRRIQAPVDVATPADRPLAKALIVDSETTGLDFDDDKIIEVCIVSVEYDRESGEIYRHLETYDALEDPGIPISAEISEITGITDAMVAGKRLDDSRVTGLVDGASIVIAHNAAFDRPFFERRFPIFESVPWACSLEQVDWSGEGIGARKLDYIAFRFGFFFDAHRARSDCFALLEILREPLPKSGSTAMKVLVDALTTKDWTVFAAGSSFDQKDQLKARRYKWDGAERVWHRTVAGGDPIKEEVAWLKEAIYAGRGVTLEFEVKDALSKFSTRPGKIVRKEI